ncbi:hypothetical protein [Flavobacterium sp. UBA4197]|uniref:hypothetical protein n=1 Tax=Flavobacterium sp. UBA4197 TaxID=1946546 RepID=UPI00257B0331|nr:hypothetical protein [Flavobacterium sp. UBA4197]
MKTTDFLTLLNDGGYDFFIENSKITVRDSLYFRGSKITSLPEGLTVLGSLDLSGTQITSLPEGLTVGDSLDLRETQITSLPEGLTAGSLDLSGTQITSLPEGVKSLYFSELCRWCVIVFRDQIKIGCERKNNYQWDDFFFQKNFIDTNPSINPEEYKKIVSAYNYAKTMQKLFLK